MATPQENRLYMEQLEERIKTLELKKEEKSEEVTRFQDIKDYDLLKVRELHAGLPVFKVAPTYVGFQGEVVLHDDESSTREIYVYLNGTWYSVAVA